jgi:hypothetical protein
MAPDRDERPQEPCLNDPLLSAIWVVPAGFFPFLYRAAFRSLLDCDEIAIAMKLPGGDAAIVDPQKLTGYCLNPGHPRQAQGAGLRGTRLHR